LNDETPQPPLAKHSGFSSSTIWKLDVTPKLKHFIWRYASYAIGIVENLRRRNINVDPYCSRCCTELETNDHTIFSCPQVTMVWRAAGFPTNHLSNTGISVHDKLTLLFQMHTDKNINRFSRYLPFWLMWRIWKRKNDLVFNRVNRSTSEIVEQAIKDTKEWLDNRSIDKEQRETNQQGVSRITKWCKPNRGWLKCNYDALHREGNQDSGLGWIIRDSHGTVLHCGMGKYQGRLTAEEAECSALIWALQATSALGYARMEFEGDNLNINRYIKEKGSNPRLRHYLATIQSWAQSFTAIKFSFRPREQNKCADLLAKTVLSYTDQWAMYQTCPPFLWSLVKNEQT